MNDAVPTPEDPLLVELADLVAVIARRMKVGAHERPGIVPLTGTEIIVLHWVDHHPGATSGETAAATGLQRSNLSAALRGLDAKGMITRTPDPTDSRSVHLEVTALARESIGAVRAHQARALARGLPSLDAAEREVLHRAVEILRRAEEPP